MNDKQKEALGDLWAQVLMLRKYRGGKYKTQWGKKTGLGIYETIRTLVIDANKMDKGPGKEEIKTEMELHNADEVGIDNQWTLEDAEYHLLLSDKYHLPEKYKDGA